MKTPAKGRALVAGEGPNLIRLSLILLIIRLGRRRRRGRPAPLDLRSILIRSRRRRRGRRGAPGRLGAGFAGRRRIGGALGAAVGHGVVRRRGGVGWPAA